MELTGLVNEYIVKPFRQLCSRMRVCDTAITMETVGLHICTHNLRPHKHTTRYRNTNMVTYFELPFDERLARRTRSLNDVRTRTSYLQIEIYYWILRPVGYVDSWTVIGSHIQQAGFFHAILIWNRTENVWNRTLQKPVQKMKIICQSWIMSKILYMKLLINKVYLIPLWR